MICCLANPGGQKFLDRELGFGNGGEDSHDQWLLVKAMCPEVGGHKSGK
ncbi:MAG: hypothetical protein K8R36_00170 [Planctomycetales bacterium]|nr:hypothetical protein [Planctomycetales bacterium]